MCSVLITKTLIPRITTSMLNSKENHYFAITPPIHASHIFIQSLHNTFNLFAPGPEFTTLTLVDLPGAHFANDDPRMNHVTQDLVLDYIKKNTKSIIVIVSEVGDPTGDSAINLVMQQAADFRSRTICVLTKPDRLRDSDDMGKKVALNKSSFTLEDGRFILLRGKKCMHLTERCRELTKHNHIIKTTRKRGKKNNIKEAPPYRRNRLWRSGQTA